MCGISGIRRFDGGKVDERTFRRMTAAPERRLPHSLARPRIALRALMARTETERIESWFAQFAPSGRPALLGGIAEHPRHPDLRGHGDPLRRMFVADLQGWLTDNLLDRGDKMTMPASLELRPPFTDRELVEWAMRLAPAMKLQSGTSKWLVRQLARRYLPPHLVDRPKTGFRVPLDEWFRGDLRGFVCEPLLSSDSFVASALESARVTTPVQRHLLDRADEALPAWTLLSLEMWHRVLFTQSPLANRHDDYRMAESVRP